MAEGTETAPSRTTPTRDLPASVELERSVLAVLLDGRHATAIHTVRSLLQHPLVFYNRNNRLIYQACLDIDDQGERIDAAGVAELLRATDFHVAVERLRQQQILLDTDQLDQLDRAQLARLYRRRPDDEAADMNDSSLAAIGGYATLSEVVGAYTSASGIERNATMLRDYYLKRRLIQRLTRISDSAHRTTEGFGELVDNASTALLALGRMGEAADKVHDMSTTVDDTLTLIQEAHDNPASGVQTGFQQVDELLTMLRPGGLFVLAARPGVGKTSFALSIAQNVCAAANPTRVLFFSLEVDRTDLVKKLLVCRAGIDFKAMERGLIEDAEWQALSNAADDLKQWQLDLMDVSDLTVQGMRSVVTRHVLEHDDGLGLVVIDYLQLLGASRPTMTEYEKVSEITRTLKILAKERHVPILALSQMNREFERSGGKSREPRLSDLRGSGSIEQDADAVFFLHKLSEDDDAQVKSEGRDVKLVVAKNRFGPLGSVNFKFFPARQRFTEVPRDEYGHGVPEVGGESRRDRLESQPSDDENLFE